MSERGQASEVREVNSDFFFFFLSSLGHVYTVEPRQGYGEGRDEVLYWLPFPPSPRPTPLSERMTLVLYWVKIAPSTLLCLNCLSSLHSISIYCPGLSTHFNYGRSAYIKTGRSRQDLQTGPHLHGVTATYGTMVELRESHTPFSQDSPKPLLPDAPQTKIILTFSFSY